MLPLCCILNPVHFILSTTESSCRVVNVSLLFSAEKHVHFFVIIIQENIVLIEVLTFMIKLCAEYVGIRLFQNVGTCLQNSIA